MTVYVLKYVFVVLHIITAAAWFGIGLRLAAQARKAVDLAGDAARAIAEDGARSVSLMNIFIGLTFVFSIAAFIAGGAFSAYGPAYHSSLTLILLLVLDQLFVIRPGWNALQAAVTGASGSDGSADGARKRVAIGTGVGHLLWLILLLLMFWDEFAAVMA